jgi:hypothetical protein
MAAGAAGQPEKALLLASAADAELNQLGIDYSGVRFWCELLDRYLTKARDKLGEGEAERAWEEGRRMGFEQAMEQALTL